MHQMSGSLLSLLDTSLLLYEKVCLSIGQSRLSHFCEYQSWKKPSQPSCYAITPSMRTYRWPCGLFSETKSAEFIPFIAFFTSELGANSRVRTVRSQLTTS